MLDKDTVTAEVRDALKETYPEGAKVRRRKGNCYAHVGDVFVLFNVQHTRWKPEIGLSYCVNWSVIPVRLFEANPAGHFGKEPKEYDPHFFARGRLKEDPFTPGDNWFEPVTEADQKEALALVRRWAEALWRERFPPMLTETWYLSELRKLPDVPAVQKHIAVLES